MKKELAFELRQVMYDVFKNIEANREKYVVDPERDFTRKRKLSMTETMNIISSIEGNSLNSELFEYQSSNNKSKTDYFSTPAFVQQRAKIRIEAFRDAFNAFNKSTLKYDDKTLKGYRLLAIDGSTLNIARNPEGSTYVKFSENRGYNQFHLNSMYDVINKTYLDVELQPEPKAHEVMAARNMVYRMDPENKDILVFDRGYGSYDLMATIGDDCKKKFVIRMPSSFSEVKDLPDIEIDKNDKALIITTQTKKSNELVKTCPYAHRLVGKSKFGKPKGYVTWFHDDQYLLNFRVVKFKVGETWEVLFTNLSKDEFSVNDLKELYHMRWGIETSFRELKYAVGLTNFHAKREELILQEIYAKLMVYNFCSRVTASVVVAQKEDNKHEYKVNFVQAIHICVEFLKHRKSDGVAFYIQKYVSPWRPGRSDERNIQPKSAVFFIYRVA